MNNPSQSTSPKLHIAAALLAIAGLLAACGTTTEPTPDTPSASPVTLSEPTDCTDAAGNCTLMMSDGSLSISGTANVPVTSMSYTVLGSTDEVISEDVPVTLEGDTFEIDLSDLAMGGYTITITAETADGDTVTITVVLVVNTEASDLSTEEQTLYVSNNGEDNAGLIDTFNERFALQSTFNAGNNEGVEVDRFGNVYQAGDGENGPSIRIISQLYDRPENAGGFDPDLDREIKGDKTELVAPKGIELAESAGLLIVADFGDGNLKVFEASDGGNVNPVEVTDIVSDGAPWDVAYDEAADRLFVAMTDGRVGVYDRYLENFGPNGPDRFIVPAQDGEKISDNLHGIAYDSGSDTLIVSDVGAATTPDQPGFKTDGSLYAFVGASTLDGNVDPERVITGRWTLLGNPVDIIYNGYDEVRVAEKANDVLLVFDNFFAPDAPSGEIMPDLVKPETKPESLVTAPTDFGAPEQPNPTPDPEAKPDVTDIDDPEVEIGAVFAVSNTPSGDDFVVSLQPDLSERLSTFNTMGATTNPENITFGTDGNAYITFDNGEMPSQGGVLIVDGLAAGSGDGVEDGDRTITGDKTNLVAPKGVEVVSSLDIVIVADFGAKDIKVFSTDADGNVAPLYTTSDLGDDMRSVWDADHDPVSDTLFVAGTDGTVLVYESYSDDYGQDGPDRELTPSRNGDKVSSNLHGIVHVADRDVLILSDVGAATTPDQDGFDADGALHVLTDISNAEGNVDYEARVRGDRTTLGNPVDITFDGSTLFVAEKTKDNVLAFEGLLNYDRGDWNIRPSASAEVNNVESVALAPEFLTGQD